MQRVARRADGPDDMLRLGGEFMLTLYYAPDNASLILRLAMDEAGVAYQTVLVDRKTRAQDAAEFRALNPAGKIPVLITPQGALSETAACLLWLGDMYPAAGLCPCVGAADRGLFLRWLFFLSNTVHADLIRMFYPGRFVPAEVIDAHHERMAAQLQEHFRILDAAVGDAPQLFAAGGALSLYLCPLMRWAALYPVAARRWFRLEYFARLHTLAKAVEARESATRAAVAEGLGPRPFSDPQLPEPPEGSAL